MSTDNHTIYLPLSGLESEHCDSIVDKGLSKVEGITSHKVELNNNRAVITTDDELEVLPKAVNAIRDLGYGVATVKKSLPVLNMSCASCAGSAQTMLQNMPGVVKASVKYANATAQVEYIPTIADPQKLKATLQSIGYDLMIDESGEAQDALEDVHRKDFETLKRRTIGAIILSIPLVLISMVFLNIPYANYIMWALATSVVLIFGQQFFIGAFRQLKHRSANMDTLVALSTGVAYSFSVFNTVYPAFWLSRGLESHVYFDAAAVVIAFILWVKCSRKKRKAILHPLSKI